jgi:hypothetical protein
MNPRVNKWVDFLERVIWTALQAAAGATIVVLGTDVTWQDGLKFVGITTLAAVVKVIVGQRFGSDETGAVLPPGQAAIQPPPQSPA